MFLIRGIAALLVPRVWIITQEVNLDCEQIVRDQITMDLKTRIFLDPIYTFIVYD